MTEMILNARILPEPLYRMIRTEKIKVHEDDGVITLTPIAETEDGFSLRGLTAGSGLTVDKFLAMTHDEKEIRQ